MVILDFNQCVECVVLRDTIVLDLQREGKKPGAFVLDRKIDRFLANFSIGGQNHFLRFQEDAIFADIQRGLPSREAVTANTADVNNGSRFLQGFSRSRNLSQSPHRA